MTSASQLFHLRLFFVCILYNLVLLACHLVTSPHLHRYLFSRLPLPHFQWRAPAHQVLRPRSTRTPSPPTFLPWNRSPLPCSSGTPTFASSGNSVRAPTFNVDGLATLTARLNALEQQVRVPLPPFQRELLQNQAPSQLITILPIAPTCSRPTVAAHSLLQLQPHLLPSLLASTH